MSRAEIKSFRYDITDSTNTRAREYIEGGGSLPALFIAEEQTSGRGRRGKSFYSPKGTGLYMSLALNLAENTLSPDFMTVSVSVALLKALLPFTEKSLSIKWVNDILADGKKVAGILCERVKEAVIVGIGVNILTETFPDYIDQSATCLGKKTDADILADSITNEIFEIFKLSNKEILKFYKSHSAVIGQNIYYLLNNEKTEAYCLDIDQNGGLVVEHTDKSRATLTSGEITLRIK